MARPMTAAEKLLYGSAFPNLDVDKAIVTDEASIVYNCISWTVGIINRPIWPGDTLAAFDAFYGQFGYSRDITGTIAVWGHSPLRLTHACIAGPGRGPRWESKCGAGLRIQHELHELAGRLYGNVVAFYSESRGGSSNPTQHSGDAMNEKAPQSLLSAAEKKALTDEIRAIPEELRARFDEAFASWKATWFRDVLLFSSDPRRRAVGEEYDALLAMGPGILPLIVDKLADPENYLALQLYDAVQRDPRLSVRFEPDDERILEGETGRARRVVQAWFSNHAQAAQKFSTGGGS